jgi:hypothetical protein
MALDGMARPGPGLVIRTQLDRIAAYSTVAVAGAVFVRGAYGLTHSPYGAEEVTYLISGGLGALTLLGFGVALFLLADLRDHHLKLGRLSQAVGRRDTAAAARWRGAAGLGAAVAGGLVMFGFGLRIAAASPRLDRAFDGLALAGMGAGLSSVAVAVVVGSAWRRIRRRADAVLENVAVLAGMTMVVEAPAVPGDEPDAVRWTADGLQRFHRRSCAALHSKEGKPRPVAASDAGLEVCLLCHPEGPPDA